MKGMSTVLLIRHGMTDAVGHQLVGWTPGVSLNAAGRDQAKELGRSLECVKLSGIYSSPLDRALQTAEAVAAHHGMPIQIRDQLGEVRFGDWTGCLIEDLSGDPEWQRWNAYRSTARTPNGESFLELQNRMVSALNEIALLHPDGIVAAVSHADAIRAALLQYLGMPADFCLRLDIQPASVSVLQFTGGAPRVRTVNIPVNGFDGLLTPAW